MYQAQYDKEGTLVEPIVEFTPEGKKSAEYMIVKEKRHGHFKQWYADGKPRAVLNYDNGEFEGEQREYYSNGLLKVKALYRNHIKDGLFEEWFENGRAAALFELKNGVKHGP